MADLTIVAADVKLITPIDVADGPADEAMAAGNLTTINTSNGKIKKGTASDPRESLGVIVTPTAPIKNETVQRVRKGLISLGNALSTLAYGAQVYASATAGKLADAAPGANEVQTITVTGSPTGGDFNLTLDTGDGQGAKTTAAIAYDAAASAVKAALVALGNVDDDDIIAAGGALPGTPVTIQFTGKLANKDVTLMTDSDAGLTGGTSPAVVVTTSTPGVNNRPIGTVEPLYGSVGVDKGLRLDL